MELIKKLVEKQTPLEEDDVKDIVGCTDGLKTIHAASSKQPTLAVGMTKDKVFHLQVVTSSHAN